MKNLCVPNHCATFPFRSTGSAGFVHGSALIMLFLLSILISSLCFICFSVRKFNVSCKKQSSAKASLLEVLCRIEKDMQVLKEDLCDYEGSRGTEYIKDRWKEYSLELADVSSGINVDRLDEKYCREMPLEKLLKEPVCAASYGWYNSRLCGKENLKFGFPFVNALPVLNANYAHKDLVQAVLDAYKEGPEEKRRFLSLLKDSRADRKSSLEALNAKENSGVLDFLGFKTAFWKVTIQKDGYLAESVMCAVPKEIDSQEILEYRPVERKIWRVTEE